ncbi:glycosyltransferase family 2 protein [Methanococcoides sp. LMO-2]|uniref:Glycosyltransferase family 2 protein n=1 Tax=Methanococcoides cohabitans TaxID=3136559 RepID=A0ABU9KV61_9EURY
MTSQPLISVIVAVYNGDKTLQRCIDSVFDQTYPNKELIVLDGGSTDDTVDILKRNNDKIAYWKSEPDTGIYNAWNKALDHVSGEWIYFLGSDDYLWKNSVFQEMASHLMKGASENIQLVYGQVARVTAADEICCVDGNPWDYTWNGIVEDGVCTFTHQGMFHHRSLFETYGKFDESYRIVGDYELLIRVFKEGGDALFVNGLIVAGMQTGGVTANCTNLVKETARARRTHSLKVVTIPWLISYAWAICYPVLNRILGDKNTRYLVNFGKRFVTGLSHKKNVILKQKNQ